MLFDAIVIGSGSVGTPAAMYLAEAGLKVLVIDKEASCGQGQNKAAIGGVRATHSDPAKIGIGLKSIEIFKNWHEQYGDDLGFKQGGYSYVAYRDEEENLLKNLLEIQHRFGLNIKWLDRDDLKEVIPGINPNGLRGGTYSPEDGQVSPLKASSAFERRARELGVDFIFKEEVIQIISGDSKVKGIKTNKGEYSCPIIVNAAGANAGIIAKQIGIDLPIKPESHEAGISCPLKQWLLPLIVDLRPGPEGKTSNFYFGQNDEGAIIFCYTPEPPKDGFDRDSTSEFLPIIAKRMIDLIPRLAFMPIRRVWRGLYPMTPDGIPIIGKVEGLDGFYLLTGMCGQGFMLGPGMGYEIAGQITGGSRVLTDEIASSMSLKRSFQSASEALK